MEKTKHSDHIYFEHLDVVRFVAAFMIVIVHSYEAWCGWFGQLGILTGGTYKELTKNGIYVDQFLRNMGIGVDIFFLLSGFLITYILLEEKKRHHRVHIGKFLIRRTLRIWPLYFFLIIITPILILWVDSPAPNYLANIFFVGNFEIIQTEQWIYPYAHFWSICIEEHFYLVWPFIIAFVPKKRLILVFTILILTSILFRIYSGATMQYPYFTAYLHTLSRMDVLVMGAVGAYFYSENPFIFNLNKSVRIALIFLLILALSLEPIGLWNSLFSIGFKKFFYIGIIAVLLLDFNFNNSFKHFLPRKSIIHYFGKISYGIYMYHNILLLVIIKKIMWHFQIHNIWAFFLISFSLCIIIPIISYELFEKHILKLNRKFRIIKTDR
ncbi:MAG: acyltransferase [Saprospiraceae bacterium]|nr:acyltransferase [Saprospiraceae bacterium]